MKPVWRRVLYWSRADRRGCLGLLFPLVIFVGCWFFLFREEVSVPEEMEDADRERYEAFLSSLQADSLYCSGRQREPYAVTESRPETFVFDPNQADSTELLRLGLRPWQVRNIYKYRARGGRYHRPEDFARVYGMTGELFARLRPYIRIADTYKYLRDTPAFDTLQVDTSVYPVKHTAGVRLELNSADTAELQRIPGIGRVRAAQIVRYRNRLGGFARLEQLGEIEGLPEGLEKWFFIHRKPVAGLKLNRLSVEALRRHPYLNFYQSKVIVEHRRKFGPLTSLEDLSMYDEFTDADTLRLRPYVCWE